VFAVLAVRIRLKAKVACLQEQRLGRRTLNNERGDVMTGGVSLWDVNDLTLGTESLKFCVTGRANKMELPHQQVAVLIGSVITVNNTIIYT
jgi:hypothetical protein